MDGRLAIESNRTALKRIVAALVVMAGLDVGAPLSRRLRAAVLRLLRPAEAATRRLVVALARDCALPVARGAPPDFASLRRGARLPGFCLLDPPRRPQRRRVRAAGVPRISVPGFGRPFRVAPPPSPDDRVDAARLAHRLAVLGRVLDDLPAQVRRLARWQARNALRPMRHDPARGGQSHSGRRRGPFQRLSPLRVGRPPRAPARGRRTGHEVHAVLASVHELALEAQIRRDSS